MDRKLGLALPAGGARAAYQVGVLRYLGKSLPEFQPKIFTGVSAGSINSSFLAQGEPFSISTEHLYELWEKLEFSQVLQTNFKSLLRMGLRWASDLFLSKVTHRLLLKSLLDATPLSHTLLSHIHFLRIAHAVRDGRVEGISVSCTNYHDGSTSIFFDSTEPIPTWAREKRKAHRTAIRVRHIMASCSIPLLFEPVRIGDFLYGDGSLRFSFPLSPAIHLGATHIFAIGSACPKPENPLGFRPDHVSLGFVFGAVLNSIFLDSLESDFENLCRMNLIGAASPKVRPIQGFLIRPSRDLGGLAKDFLSEVPFHLRQLLRSTADPEELGDLLSYLMFAPGYLKALMELGFKDAASQHDAIKGFLKS